MDADNNAHAASFPFPLSDCLIRARRARALRTDRVVGIVLVVVGASDVDRENDVPVKHLSQASQAQGRHGASPNGPISTLDERMLYHRASV